MRILYVINDPVFFLSHRLPLARAAKARGWEVHVATPYEESVRQIEEEGFCYHGLPLSKRGTSIREELTTMAALYGLFRDLKPDLLHLVTIKPVLYGGIVARLAGVPATVCAITGLGSIFVGRGIKFSLLRVFAKFAYRLAVNHAKARVIFQNCDDQAFFLENGIVNRSGAVLIKGSGVDMKEFHPTPEPVSIPIVMIACRMLWEKGVGDFVEAARYLKRRGVEARFVLVGDSVPWNKAAISIDQLQRWDKEGCVEWWGKRDDMPNIFSKVSIVCLPSYYGEGVPKVLIEAAASGKPIVTTNSPGCREIVLDGKNGLLVPPRSPEPLAAAVKRLLDDRLLREKMGNEGRCLAKEGFSVDKVIKDTFSLYNQFVTPIKGQG